MPLTTRLIAPPPALPRHRAARHAPPILLALIIGAVPALAAGPTSTSPAPGKAGATNTARTATPAKTAAAPRGKPATSRQQLKREADGLALAAATVESINEAQLNVAMRVLTGSAECEFNERVSVAAIDGQPGHFHVGHKGLRYTMVPEETTTGAVRLVDRQAGVVWLQIPVKSMLMNSKQGRRMVDACTHAEQRAAVTAVAEAGAGLGIVPLAAAMPASVSGPATPSSATAASTSTAASAPAATSDPASASAASAASATAASAATSDAPAAIAAAPAPAPAPAMANVPSAPASAPR